jgi:pimeloyl-ACP methyl ester carboxylesterase
MTRARRLGPQENTPISAVAGRSPVIHVARYGLCRIYGSLVYFNEVDRGGHFAAWEQPQLFAEELRAAFKTLR